MTAKKKQKQKKILLQRGVSVSSSSSDDDDDDDENAVIKDEKNSSERRKEKNVERMKEKIGSEMWDLTRQYKKREESVERWLNSYGFGATLMKKAVNKNNASMGGRGGESMWMYHAARALNLRDTRMPRNVKMDLDKAIEHRMKASKLVFKYAKATGEALNKAFYQHLHYLKVLRSVKMIFEGAEGEAAKIISAAMLGFRTEEEEEEEEEEETEDVSISANSTRKDDATKERRQERRQEEGNTRFGEKSGAPYAFAPKSGRALLDQMKNDANDFQFKVNSQSSKNKRVKSLEEVEKQSKAVNVSLTPTGAEIFQNMFKQQPAKGKEEEVLLLRGSQRKKNESDSSERGMSLQELERQLEMKYMNAGTALKKDEEDPEGEAMFLGSNRMDKKSRSKEEENEKMRVLSQQMDRLLSSAKEKNMEEDRDWTEVPMQASPPLATKVKVEKHWSEVPMQASHPSRSRFRFAAVEIEEEDEPIESRRVFDENTFGFNLGLSNDILNAAPAIGPGSAGFSSLNSDEDVIKEEEILDEDKKNDDKNAEVKKPRPEVLATIAKQERMQKQKFKVVDCGILTLDSSSSEEEQEEEKEKEQQEQQPQQQQRAQKPHAFVAKKKKTISFASAADAAALQAENEEAEKKRWKQKQIEAEIARKKKEEEKLIHDQRARMNALEDLNECAKTLLVKLEHAYKEVQMAWQNFHLSFRKGNGIAALLEATSVTNACIEYVDLTMRKSLKKNPELNSIERIIAAAHLVEAIRLIAEKNEHSKMSWQRALEIVSDLTFGGNYSSVIPKRERSVFAFDLLRGMNKRKESKSTLPGLKKFYESNKVKLESTGLDVPTRHAMQMMEDFMKDSKREDRLPLIEILTEHVHQQLSRMVEDVDDFCFSRNGLVIVSRMVHELFAPEKNTERLADRVLSEPEIEDVAENLPSGTSGKTWQRCIESHKHISIECAFDSFLVAFKAVFQLWATTDESRYKTFCEDLRMKKALVKNDTESAAKLIKEFYGMGECGLFPLKRLVSRSLQNNTPSVSLVFALHSMAMSRVHTDCDDSILWRSKYFRIANQVLSWEEKELIQLKDLDEHNDVFLPHSQIILSEEIKTFDFETDSQVRKDKVFRDRLSRNSPLFAGSGVLFIETMTGIVESMEWLELHRSMTFALHLYNCLRQTVPNDMPKIEILERLMRAFGKNEAIFISGKAPKKKFLTEWMLAVWGSLDGPMDDENYEKRKEQCEHGIHWLESSSVCKTIVRQKYLADDLSLKVNATREALKNDPLFGVNLSKVAVDLIALPRKMIVSLGEPLEDALSLYWETDAEECERIGQRMSMQYVLAKAILPNLNSNGTAVEDHEAERRSCETIRELYSLGDEYRKRAAKEIANMFFHDDVVRQGIYFFREFDDFEDTNLRPPRRSNARGLFVDYRSEFSRHEKMPRLKMEKEREEDEWLCPDSSPPEKRVKKKKKYDFKKTHGNSKYTNDHEAMLMEEMHKMLQHASKQFPRIIEMASRLEPERFQREGLALLGSSSLEVFELLLHFLLNLDAKNLKQFCPEALNLPREDVAIQLHALSRALSMRELQPPEVDEEEAIRRATAASLGDFTQPSHERRREDSDEVEQRSPIYDKVNFWFLAKLPDLLPESVTVPIDMYKCETIYDLMLKISQWTMRRVKVSEMILELDGRKLRKYETIDEAGIRENSELVLRTETKKRGGDFFVDDDDEDEDEDDILGGGESDSERSDASYESEYEFEYEDPSSSEGSDDD